MMNGKTILAVIPARGGSKRIPRKNIIDVNGKPLLAYTIELAKKVTELDAVVVSSEDNEILSIAKQYGAEILKRPPELAQDETQDEPVLLHTLESLEKEGRAFDYIVMLQCTLPLRTADTVRKVIQTALDGDFDTVSTTVEDRSKYRWHRNNEWIEVMPNASRRSQEREPYFREADVCYVMKASALRKSGKIFSGNYTFVAVPEIENTDINTLFDLELVRSIMEKKLS
jgi:CMP-N,N'-diacetyllegionaminic acid synthase